MHPKGNHLSKIQLAGVRFAVSEELRNKHPNRQTDILTHSLTDWRFYHKTHKNILIPSKIQVAGVRRFEGARTHPNTQIDRLAHSLTDWRFY